MKNYLDLNIHEKINIKQHAINVHGKRWHTTKPNFLCGLNQLQILSILDWFCNPLSFLKYTK